MILAHHSIRRSGKPEDPPKEDSKAAATGKDAPSKDAGPKDTGPKDVKTVAPDGKPVIRMSPPAAKNGVTEERRPKPAN
jgi:hypothetical protein